MPRQEPQQQQYQHQQQQQQPNIMLQPQPMGFVSQLDHLGHHYGNHGGQMMPGHSFAMPPNFAGQPTVISPILFSYPLPGLQGPFLPVGYQGQANKNADIGALTERMGDIRFREDFGHPDDHYGDSVARGMPGGFEPSQQHQQRVDYHAPRGMDAGRGRNSGRSLNRGQQSQPQRRPQKGMEDKIKRTVYISSIDLKVTEAELANFFSDCGRVVDCRICGDPNLAMRFAFIEFQTLDGAHQALSKSGIMLMDLPLRILPSKTAIMPVSKDLMPRSQEDIERCSRTVYVANIDKKVNREDVRNFFEELCGNVSKLRLLGDHAHPTRIAFVEFVLAEGAIAALHCSGALLGSMPLRVSPSKTPVRPDPGNPEEANEHLVAPAPQPRQQQQQQQLDASAPAGVAVLRDSDGEPAEAVGAEEAEVQADGQ